MPQSFSLSTEYIDLLQFLKATGIAMTGGEAKAIVDEGLVKVNDEPESRRRRNIELSSAEQWASHFVHGLRRVPSPRRPPAAGYIRHVGGMQVMAGVARYSMYLLVHIASRYMYLLVGSRYLHVAVRYYSCRKPSYYRSYM